MKNAKRIIGLTMVWGMLLLSLNTPALAAGASYTPAVPIRYDFYIDGGESAPLWAYEIEGGTYFKLRDLATVLNGTQQQFEVGWDGAQNAVSLTTGTAYTPLGSELSEPLELSEASGDMGAVAYPPAASFYLDGRRIPIRSYIVNGAHYVQFLDLAANVRFAPVLDVENRFAKINTKTYDAGLYSLFSLPEGWSANGDICHLDFTRSGEPVGNLFIYNYDPDVPLSQFQGNHAETLSSESLSGFAYPAAKALIRRTQPAAAQDDSYVDELHIYILLGDLSCAFDFCFDSSKVDEQTAMKIAENFRPEEPAIRLNTLASRWARAVQDRDGRAQYELLSAELQAEFKDYYEAANWVTGVSSPWVNSWMIEISGNSAVVFYENMTSTGFAGYTIDTLALSEENGQLKISGIDGSHDFSGYKAQDDEAGAANTDLKYSSRKDALKEFAEVSIADVLSQGEAVAYTVKVEKKDWMRPVRSDAWKDPAYQEKFPGSSLQVEAALHRIFELPASVSVSSSFYAPLGLDEEDVRTLNEAFGPGDALDDIGLLILNARVEKIVTLDRQTAVVAAPARSGYQVILVGRDELAADKTLLQLVTPDGYEIDYLPVFR